MTSTRTDHPDLLAGLATDGQTEGARPEPPPRGTPTLTPRERRARLDTLRAKVADNTLTLDEQREAILLLREGCIAAPFRPKPPKAPRAPKASRAPKRWPKAAPTAEPVQLDFLSAADAAKELPS